jgi:uncharacterized protein
MILDLLKAGLLSLEDYILAHTLTCLVPAFLLAGAMVTFVNREAILDHLGERANIWKAFPLAAAASFLVAACSCTVIPVASGLYFAGAGIGVAFIILWVAPAANVLALVYTGSILGGEMVAARVVAALLVAFIVGLVMRAAFSKERTEMPAMPDGGETLVVEKKKIIQNKDLGLIGLILVSLLAPNYFVQEGPYLHKIYVWAAGTLLVAGYAWKFIARDLIESWLRETWWFVKVIFPLLLGGVFLVGIIGAIIPEQWVQDWLGGNSMLASFLATLIGAVSYFATMTEAPFVDTLMGLGMGNGPALTLLLTGPGISLPNWLAIARIFGIKKALVYVPTIIVLGTLVGWFFGNFIL